MDSLQTNRKHIFVSSTDPKNPQNAPCPKLCLPLVTFCTLNHMLKLRAALIHRGKQRDIENEMLSFESLKLH